ncbi:3'-5' exonuclease [Myceligenerans indicum]|uniref:3'-5' exonuclease n=1 Tax=Myceligenerans indicum TaxID=2593663 RepID=UPI00191CD19D|nr:hypothetical protein [Myceligenerans indicum]
MAGRTVHGISDGDIAHAPAIDQIADDMRAALAGGVPAGHNVHIDLDVLTRSLPGWAPPEAFDTLKLARHAWDMPSYRLGALVEHRRLDADLPAGLRPHRAGYNALVTARRFVDLATSAAAGGEMTLDDLREHGTAAGYRKPPAAAPGRSSLFDHA